MSDIEDTQTCFRCRGMAVINKGSLSRLPGILREAARDIEGSDHEFTFDSIELVQTLRNYANMVDSMPND